MTVYVDTLMDHGWVLRGYRVKSCHMFTDQVDLTELHDMAARIGMKRSWFQPSPPASSPHYDLTSRRRTAAVAAGAVEVDRYQAREIRNQRRKADVPRGEIGSTT